MWRLTDLRIRIKSSTCPKAELSLYAVLVSKVPAPAEPNGRYVSSFFLFMPENGIIPGLLIVIWWLFPFTNFSK